MQKVSIIIPVYNVAPYIEKSLLSAFNQTYNNIEYIIVDDCGTDDSMSIVKSLITNYPRKDIKIIHHTHNRGLSAARNTGINNAIGEYIYFMDSDDTISSICIETHLNAILKYGADFTTANTQVVGGRQKLFKDIKFISNKDDSDILIGCFSGDIHITACNKLYKKDFIIKNNIHFIEGLMHEDTIWTFDIAQKAKRVVLIPDFTYFYYIREGSITTSVSPQSVIKKYDSWVHILNHIIHIAQNSENKELLHSISIWLSKIRFKISVRLIVMDVDEDIKKNFYRKINSENIRIYSSKLCSMPYGIFKLIFMPIYKNIYIRKK